MENKEQIVLLVVDDFEVIRKSIRDLLRSAGYESVREAENGRKALAILKSTKVDIVISDWDMPEMNGLDLLKAVRSDQLFERLPFIIISGTARPEEMSKAIRAGADEYIEKPFQADTLVEKVQKTINRLNSNK